MQGQADNTSTVSQVAKFLIPLVSFKHRIARIQAELKQEYMNLNNFNSKIMRVELDRHKTFVDEALVSHTFPNSILSLPVDKLLHSEIPNFYYATQTM